MDDHDDLHDRGLAFDLATLRERATEPTRLERRGALKLLAGAGAGLVLVACGSDSPSASTTSSTAGGVTRTTAGSGTSAADAIPAETGGPFPGDGTNGPNVLVESGVVREDIRSSFGAYSGTAEGVTLAVDLTIVSAGTDTPMPGATVYLWHCDREGRYSLYSSGVTDQNYLRGVQEADDDGLLRFTTVFPGAYSGRWPHIHFEVFPDLTTATSAGAPLVTSQLALPEDVCDTVYATSGYEQSIGNLAQTSLDRDMVFSDGYDQQLALVTGSVEDSLTAALTVGV
ncbi:MAG: intradiol ring-cleavage dioxygenase [Acidimicrobiales bacterium]